MEFNTHATAGEPRANRTNSVLLDRDQSEDSGGHPAISVIVAARNEELVISECLTAVLRQEISVPFELVVVDNSSTDRTSAIAKRFPCRVIHEPRPGQLIAKHSGIEAARGQMIVILDADCVPHLTWLTSIYTAMNAAGSTPVAVTSCYRYDPLPWWGAVFVSASRMAFVSAATRLFLSLPYVIGGNVAFRKDALVRSGGYPQHGGIAETELGLAMRLRRQGRIVYLPAMAVRSSSRRFRAGLISFFVDYKLKQYILPYLRRIVMSNESTESEEPVQKLTVDSFEIEQFRSLRGEILRGTEDGNQVMSYGLAAIGIVITAAVAEKSSMWGFLLFSILIPGFSSLVLSLWFGTLERVARASYFITGIEARLKQSLNALDLPTWDTWLRGKHHRRKKTSHHFWTTEYSGFGLFIFLVVAPLVMSWQSGGPAFSHRTKVIVISVAGLVELIFILWMLRRVRRWRMWLLSIFPN
jgi:hypothetical protein